MKRVLIASIMLAALCFGLSSVARADSFNAGGVIWSFTNSGSDGSGGFLVALTVDATNPSASGTLNHFSIQISDATNNATNVSLNSTSSNATNWVLAGPGNANHCGTGNLPFICFMGDPITITSGANSGTYMFVFDVTAGLSGTPVDGDVQALQGTGLAISQVIAIGGPTPSVPEPASLTFLGLGLLAVSFLCRKK